MLSIKILFILIAIFTCPFSLTAKKMEGKETPHANTSLIICL